jgi:hypothetical protein
MQVIIKKQSSKEQNNHQYNYHGKNMQAYVLETKISEVIKNKHSHRKDHKEQKAVKSLRTKHYPFKPS